MSEPGTTTITRASREWWTRPDDERYLTLPDLHAATLARAERSRVSVIPNQSLIARGDGEARGDLYLQHAEAGDLAPTHWSLGQLATIAHTPVRWIREMAGVPTGPALAAHAMNLGLRYLATRGEVQLMSLASDSSARQELRCLVGPEYGRIFDHEVVRAVMDANEDGRWKVPAASYEAKNPRRATTLYASDRDVFVFLVDEANPVEVRLETGMRRLFRGFMVWNSEVGHHRFGFMTFLYDFVCDNRTVWGAREVKEIQIRHTKNAPARFAREVRPRLRAYAEASATQVTAQLERAARLRLGTSDEEILSWLQRHDFTKVEGERIIRQATAEEGGARTLWEVVNGGTALARSIPHADGRLALERRVSRLLAAAA